MQDKIIKRGGMLAGCSYNHFVVGAFSFNELPNVADYLLPSAIIMRSVAETLYWVFIFVIYGEIFTSVIGNIFGLEKQISDFWKVPSIFIILLLFIVTVIISEVGYGR